MIFTLKQSNRLGRSPRRRHKALRLYDDYRQHGLDIGPVELSQMAGISLSTAKRAIKVAQGQPAQSARERATIQLRAQQQVQRCQTLRAQQLQYLTQSTDSAKQSRSNAVPLPIMGSSAGPSACSGSAAASPTDHAAPLPPGSPDRATTLKWLARWSQFLPMFVYAVHALKAGGTRQVCNWVTDRRELLINALLPGNNDLCCWICSIGSEAGEEVTAKLARIQNDPTTIALAVHPAEKARSCLHAHVLSLADGFREVHAVVRGGGYAPVRTSAYRSLRYLDLNSDRRHSLTGTLFGPAASPELQILVAFDHLWQRLSTASGRKSDSGWEGIFDVAELLHRRLTTLGKLPDDAQAIIPDRWHQEINKTLSEARWLAATEPPGCATDIRDAIGRLELAWARLEDECRPVPAAPPPTYLGCEKYFDHLLAALFKFNEAALSSRLWSGYSAFFHREYQRGMGMATKLELHGRGLGVFRYDQDAIDSVRQHHRNWPQACSGPETNAEDGQDNNEAALLSWAESKPEYVNNAFVFGCLRLFEGSACRASGWPGVSARLPDARTAFLTPANLARMVRDLYERRATAHRTTPMAANGAQAMGA